MLPVCVKTLYGLKKTIALKVTEGFSAYLVLHCWLVLSQATSQRGKAVEA